MLSCSVVHLLRYCCTGRRWPSEALRYHCVNWRRTLVPGEIRFDTVCRVTSRTLAPVDALLPPGMPALAHQEVGEGGDEEHDRGPHVEPQTEHVVELDGVDPEHLDPAASGGVEHHVQRTHPTEADPVALLQPQDDPEGGQFHRHS